MVMTRRGSEASLQAGTGARCSTESFPCRTRIPIRALVTDLAREYPRTGVSAPYPGAYRSAIIFPSCSMTTALTRRKGGCAGAANAGSSAAASFAEGGSISRGRTIAGAGVCRVTTAAAVPARPVNEHASKALAKHRPAFESSRPGRDDFPPVAVHPIFQPLRESSLPRIRQKSFGVELIGIQSGHQNSRAQCLADHRGSHADARSHSDHKPANWQRHSDGD